MDSICPWDTSLFRSQDHWNLCLLTKQNGKTKKKNHTSKFTFPFIKLTSVWLFLPCLYQFDPSIGIVLTLTAKGKEVKINTNQKASFCRPKYWIDICSYSLLKWHKQLRIAVLGNAGTYGLVKEIELRAYRRFVSVLKWKALTLGGGRVWKAGRSAFSLQRECPAVFSSIVSTECQQLLWRREIVASISLFWLCDLLFRNPKQECVVNLKTMCEFYTTPFYQEERLWEDT